MQITIRFLIKKCFNKNRKFWFHNIKYNSDEKCNKKSRNVVNFELLTLHPSKFTITPAWGWNISKCPMLIFKWKLLFLKSPRIKIRNLNFYYINWTKIFQKPENERDKIGKLTADDIFQSKNSSDVSIGSKTRNSSPRDQANRELANRLRHFVTTSRYVLKGC